MGKIKGIFKNIAGCKALYPYLNKGARNINYLGRNVLKNIFIVDNDNEIVSGTGFTLRNCKFLIRGNNNHIEFGNQVQWYGGTDTDLIIMGNGNRIVIEEGCVLNSTQFFVKGDNNIIHLSPNCSSIYTTFHIEQGDDSLTNSIIIGEKTTFHGRKERMTELFLDEGTTLKIGEDCMLSNNVQIRTTDSHSVTDKLGNRFNYAKDIVIGDHVWIGMDSMILKGVTIPNNVVVAARSVCTRRFYQNNILVGGVPASILKTDINWSREQIKKENNVTEKE